jgi:HD-like signal output (HDOD) protein
LKALPTSNTCFLNFHRNIGEAFLLVWKFPNDVIKMNKEYPEILNLRLVNNYADFALLALIKIYIAVRKSESIFTYTRM